jgi:predicted small secreted protein
MNRTDSLSMKKGPLALLALSAFLFAACEDGAGPGRDDVQADLKELASKVSSFSPPSGPKPSSKDGLMKRAGLAKDCWNGSVDGVTRHEEPASADNPTAFWDTTWHFTAAGKPACDEGEEIAYETFSSRNKDSKYESWLKGRTDYGALAAPNLLKMSATGTVRYNSGYEFAISSFKMALGEDFSVGQFAMVLSLKAGRYTVDLGLAPGTNLDDDLAADKVALTGPIKKGAAVVGYMDVMGDDRIIIRDAEKKIVSAH